MICRFWLFLKDHHPALLAVVVFNDATEVPLTALALFALALAICIVPFATDVAVDPVGKEVVLETLLMPVELEEAAVTVEVPLPAAVAVPLAVAVAREINFLIIIYLLKITWRIGCFVGTKVAGIYHIVEHSKATR